jgi:hypothetical protein
MAGKKEAKQKAGPRGQTEKNREETESSTGRKNTSEEDGQKAAQGMQRRTLQRKEAQKAPKVQGEPKKPGMTKRRQVRKVATMVKRLKKNPEDGIRGWIGRSAAGHGGSLRSIEGNATSRSAASPCQLNGENLAQRKRREPG